MNVTRNIVAAAMSALLSVSLAYAVDASGEHFIKESIQTNLAEGKIGDLAEQKAASEAVRDFGAMLASDHALANKTARQAIRELGVTSPKGLSVKQKAMFTELSALSPDKFDRHFIDSMVKDHQEEIAQYEKEANSGSGAAADYAMRILPDLRRHLDIAQRLQQQEAYIGHRFTDAKGNTECVEFIKQALGAPPSSSWRLGRRITRLADGQSDPVERGTAIATFVNGQYPQRWKTGIHAALYLGQNAAGIQVLDQWRAQGRVKPRTIPWIPRRPGLSNDGRAFSVIEW
jgi:predicted outer membrane protein